MTDAAVPLQLKTHRLPRIAGLIVSVASAGFVFGLLAYLFYSADLQNDHFATYSSQNIPETCADEFCRFAALEADIQQMRSARVGYALIYRFSLAAAAIIVSLATIVLGAVLVFDRVQSAADNVLVLESEKYKATITSTWPGLVMVALGSFTLCISVVISGPMAPRLNVVDVPVFVEDPNSLRNAMGLVAMVQTVVPVDARTEGEDFPSLFDTPETPSPNTTEGASQ